MWAEPQEKIKIDTDRDYIMEAEQAVEYGLVDKIVTSAKKPLDK